MRASHKTTLYNNKRCSAAMLCTGGGRTAGRALVIGYGDVMSTTDRHGGGSFFSSPSAADFFVPSDPAVLSFFFLPRRPKPFFAACRRNRYIIMKNT